VQSAKLSSDMPRLEWRLYKPRCTEMRRRDSGKEKVQTRTGSAQRCRWQIWD